METWMNMDIYLSAPVTIPMGGRKNVFCPTSTSRADIPSSNPKVMQSINTVASWQVEHRRAWLQWESNNKVKYNFLGEEITIPSVYEISQSNANINVYTNALKE